MPCSEFVFQVVMRRRGIRVKKLRAGDPLFYFNGTQKYRPDFVDPKTNIYYEVSSSRQALHQSRPKLKMMKRYHPQTKYCWFVPTARRFRPHDHTPHPGGEDERTQAITDSAVLDGHSRKLGGL